MDRNILYPITKFGRLRINATHGKKRIFNSKKVFRSIDSDFEMFRMPSMATKEIFVKIYDVIKDATFLEIFESLECNLDQLCMTEHQILNFVHNHKQCLANKIMSATFFLMKYNEEYYVVSVYYDRILFWTSLNIRVDGIELPDICRVSRFHRVVLPI
jgi:hypothetical protein